MERATGHKHRRCASTGGRGVTDTAYASSASILILDVTGASCEYKPNSG